MDELDEQAVRAARLFFDNDTTRQIIGHQPVAQDGAPPLPGYERILKVTIPITIEQTTHNNGDNRTVWTTDIDTDRLDDINPIDPGYLPTGELGEDTTLQTWLLEPPDLGGPAVIGSSRQLINVDDPLLTDLTDQGVDNDRLAQLKPVLDAHERDSTTQGSHASTILDHRSRSAEVQSALPAQQEQVITTPELSDAPSQSEVFHELMAIVSERRVAPQLPEREALDALRRDTGGQQYSLALDILDWLRTNHPRRLSYTQITDLLNYCRASVCPDRMLTHFLADLSHGMPPEDIPYHSSFFDRVSRSPNELYNRLNEDRQGRISEPYSRVLATTFETIRLGGGPDAHRLIKEWWSYDPPAVVAPMFVRHILLLRRLYQQATHNGRALVQSTTSNGRLGFLSFPALAFQYQIDDAAHPLEEAMDTTTPPDLTRLSKRLQERHPRHDDMSEAVNQVWQRTRNKWFTRQDHFADTKTLGDWLTGDAPRSSDPFEVCQHYL